jgi:hypothetical protein
MALRYPSPHLEIHQAAAAAMIDRSLGWRVHQVYSAPLEALAAPLSLDQVAEAAGWYYLAETDEVSIEVVDSNGEPEAERNDADPSAADLIQATRQSIEIERVAEEIFEARLLRVPELAMTALWLRPMLGDSLVILVDPAPASLESQLVYEESLLLETLSKLVA